MLVFVMEPFVSSSSSTLDSAGEASSSARQLTSQTAHGVGGRIYVGVEGPRLFDMISAVNNATEPGGITKIVIWDCVIDTYAEADYSHEIYSNRHSLEKFVYFPRRTRGAGIIRPTAWKGDTAESREVEFPQLKTLCYILREANFSVPTAWGWKAPNLKKLVLLLDKYSLSASIGHQLRRWSRQVRGSNSALAKVIKASPHLKEIQFCIADAADHTLFKKTLLWRLTPCLDWARGRLLWVAHRKQSPSDCPFAALPMDIAKIIFREAMTWSLYIPSLLEAGAASDFIENELRIEPKNLPV